MFHDWANLFEITGAAGAQLIGLVFVAVTLGVGLSAPQAADGIRAFMTPTLFNFGSVLFQAVLMLAPWPSSLAPGVVLIVTALVGLPLPVKMAITAGLIAPLGFVMGMPFPTGLRRLEQWHAPSVRWAWSLNAAASVMGSVGALVCAIYLGLIQTLILGGLFYLAALAVVARVNTRDAAAPETGPGRVVLGN